MEHAKTRSTVLGELAKAAVELAIVRHDLSLDDCDMTDECRREVAFDTWNAMTGIGTCSGEVMPEVTAALDSGAVGELVEAARSVVAALEERWVDGRLTTLKLALAKFTKEDADE